MRELPRSNIEITPVMFFGFVILAGASSFGDRQLPDSGSENATFLPVRRPSGRSGVVSSGVDPESFPEQFFVVPTIFNTPILSGA
jgi:hypothetical protein